MRPPSNATSPRPRSAPTPTSALATSPTIARFFRRASLQLGTGPDPARRHSPPTNACSASRPASDDPGLLPIYFQFGRYLLISSSRPGTLAANLQGIWNESVDPPWGSKYTVNINAEMNYWIAERANLADLHTPLFDLIDMTRARGRSASRKTTTTPAASSCTTTPTSGATPALSTASAAASGPWARRG